MNNFLVQLYFKCNFDVYVYTVGLRTQQFNLILTDTTNHCIPILKWYVVTLLVAMSITFKGQQASDRSILNECISFEKMKLLEFYISSRPVHIDKK